MQIYGRFDYYQSDDGNVIMEEKWHQHAICTALLQLDTKL